MNVLLLCITDGIQLVLEDAVRKDANDAVRRRRKHSEARASILCIFHLPGRACQRGLQTGVYLCGTVLLTPCPVRHDEFRIHECERPVRSAASRRQTPIATHTPPEAITHNSSGVMYRCSDIITYPLRVHVCRGVHYLQLTHTPHRVRIGRPIARVNYLAEQSQIDGIGGG